MRFGIFGAGGVGGYFGGRLALSGEDVVFIARGAHLEALQNKGLIVNSIKGGFQLESIQATDDPELVGAVDVILVSVKAWQVPEAAYAMRPMIGEDTLVVPLCNGVEAPSQLSAVLGEKYVVGGLCRISAYIQDPGHIQHVGVEPYIALGELDGEQSLRCNNLRDILLGAGVSAAIPDDIEEAMWKKFIFIAAISGMGAVTRVPIGTLRTIPETRGMLIAAMEEIYVLSQARGVHMADDIVERTLVFIDEISPDVIPSMQRDMMQGRPSELESQNGAVVRMGRESGAPTLVNKFIYSCLLPQENAARQKLGVAH
jgi:2-dehydropantoate 2-reductase